MNNLYVSIMAGGVGSRFWPSSTEAKPKQFLDILGIGKSLLRMTYDRFAKIVPNENILIVTNAIYKDLVKQHLPEILDHNILCEPSRNNTGPCVAYTALRLGAINPDAIFVTAPSDHVILYEDVFLEKIKEGVTFIEQNQGIVTLGITPTRPDTGYGYIEIAPSESGKLIQKVSSFKEKPDQETAQQYIDAGNYYWNGGIFIWKATDLLNDFHQNAPEILEILSKDVAKYGSPDEQKYINEVYPLTPSISVDYAILEKSNKVYTIKSDIGWSDLGTWNSLHDYLDKDESKTVRVGKNIYLSDTENSIVRSDNDRTIVIKGLKNYIVIDEEDALLIYPLDQEQEIKKVVANLK